MTLQSVKHIISQTICEELKKYLFTKIGLLVYSEEYVLFMMMQNKHFQTTLSNCDTHTDVHNVI